MTSTYPVAAFPALPRNIATMCLRIALLLALVLGATTTGCPSSPLPTLPVVTTDDPAAEAELREAREAAENGEFDQAIARYRAFLVAHPEDPLVPVAQLSLGRLLLGNEAGADLEEARRLFREVQSHEDAVLRERAAFYDAVAVHLQGDHQRALDALTPLVGRTVDPEDTALLLQTIAAASSALGDRVATIEAYDAIANGTAPAQAQRQAQQTLRSLIEELPFEQSRRLFESLSRDGFAWPIVARRALRQSFQRGDLSQVRVVAAALEEGRVPLDAELRAMVLRAERTGDVNPNAIGAILPLSGRGREVGQRTLEALMLAAGVPPDAPAPANAPQLHFRDSQGSAEAAVAAVDDLVTLHQVIAIVGPLNTTAARAAAARAAELGVPLIALAPDAELPNTGPLTFRLSTTPEEEIRALVQGAVARGNQRIAVFAPTGGYGDTFIARTQQVCENLGVAFAGGVSYTPGSSLRDPIGALKALDFDAVLLPDRAGRQSLVIPALAASGVAPAHLQRRGQAPVQLLLPGIAYDANLQRNSGRYIEGALVALSYAPTIADTPAARFDAEFRERYGHAPFLYSAMAYDAFRAIRQATSTGAEERSDVAGALGSSLESVTVTGGLGAERGPRRAAEVYEVREGNLEAPRDPAPRG